VTRRRCGSFGATQKLATAQVRTTTRAQHENEIKNTTILYGCCGGKGRAVQKAGQ